MPVLDMVHSNEMIKQILRGWRNEPRRHRGALTWVGLAGGLLISAVEALAAGSFGSEVVVIYNKKVPESQVLAQYYAEKRQVPTNQIFGFALSTTEEITRAEFRDELQKPLAKALSDKKLWRVTSRTLPPNTNGERVVEWAVSQSAIRYAVLCYGVPLKIAKDANLKEEGTEKLRPELRRDEASVDSELALLPLFEQRPPLNGPLRNPVYTTTNSLSLHPTNGVLMVARLDGPTVAIARGLVDKALEADRGGLWGRAYFDLRSVTDPGYKQGDDWIRSAYDVSRHLGLESVLDTNATTFSVGFPMSQIALYFGWYDGDASGPFTRKEVEFAPGAIAYHLHSFSAFTLRSTTQNWVGPLLAKGATATLGAVNEPYLAGTPDLGILAARLIFNGFTFGEAAWAAQSVVSWQITVVGDPLYRPFGKNGDLLHQELELKKSKNLEWSWLRLANLNIANGKPIGDWVVFLEQLELTRTSAVLTEKLGDLYLAQGKPSSAVHAYQQALSLGASPMQKLRLFLNLGERCAALERDQEALEAYQQALKDYPDCPEKLALYKLIHPFATRLKLTPEIQRIETEIARLSPPPPKSQ